MTGLLFEPGKRVVVTILSRFSKKWRNFKQDYEAALLSWIHFRNMVAQI